MDIDENKLKTVYNLTRFEMQYPQFRLDTVARLLDDVMLHEVKTAMAKLYFSKKIIDATRIADIQVNTDGTIDYSIISDYTTKEGFDVSKAREEGTKKHWIAPTKKLALTWVAGYIRLFSKGHWVRGIKKSNVIKKTRKKIEPKVQKMLDEATDNFYLELIGKTGEEK